MFSDFKAKSGLEAIESPFFEVMYSSCTLFYQYNVHVIIRFISYTISGFASLSGVYICITLLFLLFSYFPGLLTACQLCNFISTSILRVCWANEARF